MSITISAEYMKKIIDEEKITTVYQPIVSLRDGSILGYEALTRGPAGLLESPLNLFASAEAWGFTWELEYLCRRLAIERFSSTESDKVLFINVNPAIVEDPRFREGYTRQHLIDTRILTSNVVFEITEKTSISNYLEFCQILKHYTDQGFRIAIDDTGAGYSGLNLLARLKPQFVKIDMELIRDIDKDPFKQNLLKFFVDFALSTGITLIAEGIETVEEVRTLLATGVEFGQGFYLGRPDKQIKEIAQEVLIQLRNLNKAKVAMSLKNISTVAVGEFSRAKQWLPPDTPCSSVSKIFETNEDVMGIPIVENGIACGLVMRDRFFMKLGSQYGYSLFSKRLISMVMDTEPLMVDYYMPIEQVSKLAMGRSKSHLYDYIIVTLDSKYYGIISVKDLLERTTEMEIKYAKYTQPLTGLPGNVIIESEINRLLSTTPAHSILYVDLDNFKAYNDTYGFNRGDELIRFTAQLLEEHFKGKGFDCFVGHIGGDDFVVACDNWEIQEIIEGFIKAFDEGIRRFYNEPDLKKGFITSMNRKGEKETFPLTTVSVAVVWNKDEILDSYHWVSQKASELKKKCKSVPCSVFCYGEC